MKSAAFIYLSLNKRCNRTDQKLLKVLRFFNLLKSFSVILFSKAAIDIFLFLHSQVCQYISSLFPPFFVFHFVVIFVLSVYILTTYLRTFYLIMHLCMAEERGKLRSFSFHLDLRKDQQLYSNPVSKTKLSRRR